MLGFPDYYGSNLDALYDELTSVATATTVEIHNAGEDDCTKMILRVFQDAEEENEYLDIVLAVN
jgi:RNAse (barnase) inhibitor barstar